MNGDQKWRIRRVQASGGVAFSGWTLPVSPAGWEAIAPTCIPKGWFTFHSFRCRCRRGEDFPSVIAYATEQARAERLAAIQDGAS